MELAKNAATRATGLNLLQNTTNSTQNRQFSEILLIGIDNIIIFVSKINDVQWNLRETVFLTSVKPKYDVMSSSVADFKVGKYTFEVGGKNKKQKQIQGVENAFVVKDDIEYGYLNVIPLWTFGLLY